MFSVEQKVFLATLLQIACCHGRHVASSCQTYPISVVLACACARACSRATLDKFQMSGSVLNKIKIRMCSGCMQNHRALVFSQN